ncbi:MAG: helix-turn-helix domain-containing protein [Chloroflexota bacterium]|nr:helix-turn-helix domain-containing protein [Chloroflexota bacterium]
MKWDAGGVRALRHHLGMTQQEMAGELGVRQQTVSEWETGSYRPRGPSSTLLSLVAEGAGFQYEGGRPEEKGDAQVIPHAPLARGSTVHENRAKR